MIGIICAMKLEAKGIERLLDKKSEKYFANMRFTEGVLHGESVVVCVCGVGKVNATICTSMMIEHFKPEIIVNSGIAGAVSDSVSIGDIVVADKAVEHDMNTIALGDSRGTVFFPNERKVFFECNPKAVELLTRICKNIENTRVEQGTIASGDMFVSEYNDRVKVGKNFSALACEMEGAAVGHTCYCFSVPYVIIRAISDDLNMNTGADFDEFCETASKKTVGAVDDFVRLYHTVR